jgi:hypothetical protein
MKIAGHAREELGDCLHCTERQNAKLTLAAAQTINFLPGLHRSSSNCILQHIKGVMYSVGSCSFHGEYIL